MRMWLESFYLQSVTTKDLQGYGDPGPNFLLKFLCFMLDYDIEHEKWPEALQSRCCLPLRKGNQA